MAVLYDVTGFDPAVIPLPANVGLLPADEFAFTFHSKTESFFDVALQEAHLRLDQVPSFKATWHDEANHTYVDMDTVYGGTHAYVGGVQHEDDSHGRAHVRRRQK
jgi:membrane carboxypeptidase/penicillin-binding protein